MGKRLSQEKVERLNEECEERSTEEILSWVLREYGDKVALASSLGVEDMVLTDLLLKISGNARIFTLDTGRLPKETYTVISRVREKYGNQIEIYFPDGKAVEEMVNSSGINLFYDSVEARKRCCHVRKIDPLKRALSHLDAWICGLRREQSVTRTGVYLFEIDEGNGGIVKVNPLYKWSEEDVWNYIREHDVPYNELHDRNYPSIGCEPCTRAVREGEDVRAGRWWWESPDQKECGLHGKKNAQGGGNG